MNIITLDVGGKIFKIRKDLLILKSEYFNCLFLDNPELDKLDSIYIDRSPHIFKHILAYIRDQSYPYPEKYKSELDYFLINKEDKKSISKDEIKKYIYGKICINCKGTKPEKNYVCDLCMDKVRRSSICPFCNKNKDKDKSMLCNTCVKF